MRLKAANNLKNQRSTGGGPNQTKSFTPIESAIYDLIGMKESVEGLESCKTFGAPDYVLGTQIIIDENESERHEGCQDQESPEHIINTELPICSTKKPNSSMRNIKKTTEKLSIAALIAEELKHNCRPFTVHWADLFKFCFPYKVGLIYPTLYGNSFVFPR